MWLWVDDLRQPPTDGWVWVKTVRDAMAYLRHNTVDRLSLDHDLGNDQTTRPIVLWLCETDEWPEEVMVHSQNPVGREWLEGMVGRYHNA
jgi:hypothetical protein